MPVDASTNGPTPKSLKLIMSDHAPVQTDSTDQGHLPTDHESGGSPQRPSYSPVTPTLSQASFASRDGPGVEIPATQWIDEPPEPLPISLDDNPDAIALRATLSILQLQRQQAIKDMRDLDKMKEAALENPEQFVQQLQASKLNRPPRAGLEVDDLEPVSTEEQTADDPKFGQLPVAQNIVRAPPIEWAKYHIVGEPLDRIHRTQQQYPGSDEQGIEQSRHLQPHTIATPYRPFIDKVDETTQNTNGRAS